jgi:hypothetical protein
MLHPVFLADENPNGRKRKRSRARPVAAPVTAPAISGRLAAASGSHRA